MLPSATAAPSQLLLAVIAAVLVALAGTPATSAGAATLAAGRTHACAITAARTVACWGANGEGQLGLGDRMPRATATEVPGTTGAIAVAAAVDGTCAVVLGGRLRCWGARYGVLYRPPGTDRDPRQDILRPLDVAGVTDAVDLSLHTGEVCVIRRAGRTVRCLAARTRSHREDALRPMRGLKHVTQLAAGDGDTCARERGGTVLCWGDRPQTERNETYGDYRDPPVSRVTALQGARSIGLSEFDQCGVFADGRARCAGRKAGTSTRIHGLDHVTALGSGLRHCAVHGAGRVACIGLGNDGPRVVREPAIPPAPTLTDAVAVVAGDEFACAHRRAGPVVCWGANTAAMGSGTPAWAAEPVEVPGLQGALDLSTSEGGTCVLRADRGVSCWGRDALGTTDGPDAPSPVAIPGISNAATLSTGSGTGCAVTAVGDVRCWGRTGFGTLDPNAVLARVPPGAVLSGAPGCFAGAGKVACIWLAEGRKRESPPIASAVDRPELAGATKVTTSSDDLYCGLRPDRQVVCSVEKEGDPGVSLGKVVTVVPGFADVRALSAWSYGVCALRGDSTVSCWGTGPSETATTEKISGLTGATSISLGSAGVCAVVDGGKVRCTFPTSTPGTTDPYAPRPVYAGPYEVAGLTDAVKVAVADRGGCALRQGGRVSCWGSGLSGRLGDGPMPAGHGPQTVPQPVVGLGGPAGTASLAAWAPR